MEETDGARYEGKGPQLPRPLQAHHSPGISTCSPTQKLSKPGPFGF